jgi:cytochrome c oxidase cbb3-type subunit 4
MLAGILTLVWMLAFLALWAWAWKPSRRAGFDAAARLAVEDAPPADPKEAGR